MRLARSAARRELDAFQTACKGADNMFSRLFAKRAANPDPTTIGRDALAAELKSGACVVIDVREPHEYAAGHIPGAVNQPLSRFDPGLLPAGNPVVLVCKSGARSASALRQALAAGRSDVRYYPEGTMGWQARGGEVVTG